MDIQFQKLGAENFAELSKYYGRRHDNTCDSVMLDNFLWADYYHVHFCERDDKAVLWIMKILGKMYASLPVCAGRAPSRRLPTEWLCGLHPSQRCHRQ